MFNINKWVWGSISAVSLVRSLILPEGFFGELGRGGTVIYPNEFCFCLLTCNETWENNLNCSIRKDTGHLSGFPSRAMVNSWNVKMLVNSWNVKMREGGGIEVNPLGFFFWNYQVYFLWAALHFKSHESSSFMFETHFVFEFGEK